MRPTATDISRNTPITELPTLLSVDEFCAYTGVHRNTVYNLIHEKAITDYVVKLGREYRINKNVLSPKIVSVFDLQRK